jgi:hypothetical protein
MSWEDQGRQYHMWFGHGMAPSGNEPPKDSSAAMFVPDNFEPRIDAIAHTALANMAAADRHYDAASFD